MKGKIFESSNNLYQDQAKILFDYYQQKAEKIVKEEERIEKEINLVEQEKSVLTQQMAKARMWKWLLLILIIPFFIFLLKENGIKKQIKVLDEKIKGYREQHTGIFRDYKITRLGISYVPVAEQVQYENKSFIVDHTGMSRETEIRLQLPKENELLIETIAEIEKLSQHAPLVDGSDEMEEIETEQYSRSMDHLKQHNYIGKLDRSMRNISGSMDDLDVTSVSLPLVASNSRHHEFLREYATDELPAGVPVFEVFNIRRYDEQVAKFKELNKLRDSLSRHTQRFEDVLKNLMMTMAGSVQAISSLKVASADKIIFEANKILFRILKSPYNHYSPVHEAAEIDRIRNENFHYGDSVQDYVPFQLKESSKVKYNLTSGMWSAEDGTTIGYPFGVHQIHEEIVAPIVENLMKETRIERLKIYNNIKDQKINYLNKWHQETESFYGRHQTETADLINLMSANLRDYVAAYKTLNSLQKTSESMSHSKGSLESAVVQTVENAGEMAAMYESQSEDFERVRQEFAGFMDQLKDDIDYKAQEFEHIDYYDALLRDGVSRDVAVASSEVHDIDERRKPLTNVNPLFAKISELPPCPSMENLTSELLEINLSDVARNTIRELDEDMENEELHQDSQPSGSSTPLKSPEAGVLPQDQEEPGKMVEEANEDETTAEPDTDSEFDIEADSETNTGEISVEDFNVDDHPEIMELINTGTPLAAVKRLKEITGWGLKECKDWVDSKK